MCGENYIPCEIGERSDELSKHCVWFAQPNYHVLVFQSIVSTEESIIKLIGNMRVAQPLIGKSPSFCPCEAYSQHLLTTRMLHNRRLGHIIDCRVRVLSLNMTLKPVIVWELNMEKSC